MFVPSVPLKKVIKTQNANPIIIAILLYSLDFIKITIGININCKKPEYPISCKRLVVKFRLY